MKKIIEKFRKGKYVTLGELGTLIYHLETLTHLLSAHGELYQLTLKDAQSELDRATAMMAERTK